ncbi:MULTISPECIES: transglutaminase-like cysteine peptidase [Ensifer]|uniref:transglutaminase-like cysteine peptidase n=1 Tax=Ensifer TaxID=106591 RepID=UPI001FEF9E46|nr:MULTISPECIES: transglutaminase-like cysteine peptidase [Ensifer]UTV41514.1 transglutaminase-like cysteine peptidase [Ensifer adhaerens]
MNKTRWKHGRKYLKTSVFAIGLASLFATTPTQAGQPAVLVPGLLHQMVSLASPLAAIATQTIDTWSKQASEALRRQNVQQVALATRPDLRPQPSAQSEPSAVFHSVAFRVSAIPVARKWKTVYPAVVAADFNDCAQKSGCAARDILGQAIENADGLAFRQKISGINRTVNRIVRYQPDAENYGAKDYWATPDEILARGKGDCEDYAILKMAALKAAGLPSEAMSIVVLRDVRRNLYHAVLAITTSQGHFILDNLSDQVKLDTALPSYQPLFSVSAERSWIHGIKSTGDKVASAAPLADVMPGEGIAVR